MRGFEVAQGFEDSEVELPKRSTAKSAGYDFKVIEDTFINPGQIKLIPTGVKAFMADDEVLKIYARSSLPKKKNLIIPNSVGIIDSDYYGNPDNDGVIYLQVYNIGKNAMKLNAGERVAQGIFEKFLTVTNEEAITETRQGGIGSTDKIK